MTKKAKTTLTFEQASEVVQAFQQLDNLMQEHELLSLTDAKALADVRSRIYNKVVKSSPTFWKHAMSYQNRPLPHYVSDEKVWGAQSNL